MQGQLSLLIKRQDIDTVISDPKAPKKLKRSLQHAIEIRQFASSHLHLPENKSYLKYADLQRPYVVWNVFAAPEFSLTAKTWCYPIVGCVSYRGYFDEQDAKETAESLKQQNYDVHVAGVAAYSTLGWFDDPLLNTMMHWSDRSLASLIFHELSHQVIYISSETAFNEAFSSAVERLGTIQWLANKSEEDLEKYLAFLSAQQEFRLLLIKTKQTLEILYSEDIAQDNKRKQKNEIISMMERDYQTLKSNWHDNIHFDYWFKQPINNARLTSTMTYLRLIPAFYQIFLESHADWKKFYTTIKTMEDMESTDRSLLIEDKLTKAPDITALINLLKPQ